jgi:nitroimidazol reductase NimA-like FMN-containing flavoprotein (pyridoxamine 5'-phosphate oxidase superfamily)
MIWFLRIDPAAHSPSYPGHSGPRWRRDECAQIHHSRERARSATVFIEWVGPFHERCTARERMLISKIQDRECRDLLARLGLGSLGCARDNQPYVVPIYFAYEPDHLYAFATFGRKIEWMRTNPLVCVQADEILGNDNWTSVEVRVRYEELLDTPKYARERSKAQSLLEKRQLWWQTSYVASTIRSQSQPPAPVFFRIHIEEISGLRASPVGAPVRVR